MKTLTVALTEEKNKLDTTSVWLVLLQVSITDLVTLYLVPNAETVTFNGHVYSPFGCTVEDVKSDSRGGLQEVAVHVSNVTRVISGYIETNDLRGRTVTILGVNSANLADPNATAFNESYEINTIAVTQEFVTFNLSHVRLLQQRFPSRRFLRDNCQHLYKGTECAYAGAIATCDKTLEGTNGCRIHANHTRFGAFPGMPSVAGRLS